MKQPNKKKYLTKSNEKLDHKRSKNQVLNMQDFLLKQRVEQDKKLSRLLMTLHDLTIQKDYKEKHGTYKDSFDKKKAWDFARETLKPFGYKK